MIKHKNIGMNISVLKFYKYIEEISMDIVTQNIKILMDEN